MKHQRSSMDASSSDQEDKPHHGDRLIPKKADYRMRAHINPLNSTTFPYPLDPTYVDWRAHYPALLGGTQKQNHTVYCNTVEHPVSYENRREYSLLKKITVIDIGCGFGGLLFGLSQVLPENLILGLEIRDKLVNYVGQKIRGFRITNPGCFNNIAVVRTNTMRHLCQYFQRSSLQKIFICFADPHFKAKNHRRRIINTGYLSEYAYLLAPKGRLYCITDVLQLHQWHIDHLKQHRMFKQVDDPNDPCIKVMINKTQEGLKVQRNQGQKYWAIYQRILQQ